MTTVEIALEFVREQPIWLGLIVLGVCSLVEYVFPPFPGDTVTVVGAILIPTAGWPWWGVFLAVMIGSILGAAGNWYLGSWLVTHPERNTWAHRLVARPNVAPRIDKIKAQFTTRGGIYLVLNRFIPAFRSLFFIAAGLAKMRVGLVLILAGLSALLWNGALLICGLLVGNSLPALLDIVATYTEVVMALICAAIVVILLKGRFAAQAEK